MLSVREAVDIVREKGRIEDLSEAIPYAGFLGLSFEVVEGEPLGKMKCSERLIGNAHVHALHGGTLGALMETTAIFRLLWEGYTEALPKTINITVEYLRSANIEDTWARAEFTRLGRRVANVRMEAWQSDLNKPVATATGHFLLRPR